MADPLPTTAFDVLAHPVRRRLVRHLHDYEERSIAVDDLATALAGRVSNGAAATRTPSSAERLEIELHHLHLPKMADAGVIEYDRASHRVVVREIGPVYDVLRRTVPLEPAAERCE
ncbi:helix-turn-helix domain-containing protein [Natrononativus amylolyticus]|uniref:helix-turn-helix domain-containing protein n=1 Tax=Natrononativus amylolyticus TaxID=2963434 RepID=UPI0020CFB65C|nr:helix-turn-helix domain-containing protein [Natrononativus amylolyticus]